MNTELKNAPLVFEKTYHAPVERVWKALTDRDQLAQWSFDMDAFKPEVGFEFHFSGTKDGIVFHHICVVKEVIVGRKLSYSWRYENLSGDSLVTWELFADGPDRTNIRLTHTGLETFPQDKNFAKGNFQAGWTQLAGTNLKDCVEKG